MNINRNYFTKLLAISEEYKGIELNFKDRELEKEYQEKNKEKEKYKSKIFTIYACTAYIIALFSSLYANKFKLISTGIIQFITITLEIVLSIFTHKFCKKHSTKVLIKYIRFLIYYFDVSVIMDFPFQNISTENYIRLIYITIIIINFIYLYFFEFNYIMIVLVPVLNTVNMFVIQYRQNYSVLHFITEIFFNFFYYLASYLIKKHDFLNKKKIVYENYKNDRYVEYIDQLIDALNTMVISINKNDILYMNKYSINYFEINFQSCKSTDRYHIDNPNENLSFQKQQKHYTDSQLTDSVHSFFNQLFLNDLPGNNNDFKNETFFSEVLNQIFSEEENLCSTSFKKVGNFLFKNDNKINYFDINVRKIKYKEEVLEILIYDITEIKLAEKANIESKYKQKILSKIAHEFKTPLITIISLINKFTSHSEKIFIDENVKKYMNHINYLSNYTLYLVSDIIQYVSDSMNLIIKKEEIDIKEVLEFSHNVMKTLIDCNENKINKIQPIIELEEGIENVSVITDENRLKQILLNFISNSVKFTLSGFIKIKASFNIFQKQLEISVEDTGLGIKEEDHLMIFQENIELNINQEYNCRGSGLGLSICKSLSELLGHKISFNSKLNEGSTFQIFLSFIDKQSNHMTNQELKIPMIDRISDIIMEPNNISESIGNNINIISFETEKKSRERSVYSNLTTLKNIYYPEKEISNFQSFHEENKKAIEDKFIVSNYSFSFKKRNTIDDGFGIVVIDDHKMVRYNSINLIKNVLKSLKIVNYFILEGSDGIDLLNFVRDDKLNKIKYIFCDENMEYLNGSDVIKIIRILEESKKIKRYYIISITAFEDKESRNKILKAGVDQIMSKPCSKSELIGLFSNE